MNCPLIQASKAYVGSFLDTCQSLQRMSFFSELICFLHSSIFRLYSYPDIYKIDIELLSKTEITQYQRQNQQQMQSIFVPYILSIEYLVSSYSSSIPALLLKIRIRSQEQTLKVIKILSITLLITIITMFLNLKNKKFQAALQNHLKAANHPKTQRDQRQQRSSKQHIDIRNKRIHGNGMIKKQTASTALTTMQPGSSCTNMPHHYIIHRVQSIEKDASEVFTKSIEKIDSHRSQKVANAYRKIKRIDGDNRIQTEQSFEDKPRKSNNRTHNPLTKKQILNNIANNYIAITQTQQYPQHQFFKNEDDKGIMNYYSKLLQILLEVFRKQSKGRNISLSKLRSTSSRDSQLNESLEKSKRSNKNLKKSDKGSTIPQNNDRKQENIRDFLQRTCQSVNCCEQKFESLSKSRQQASEINTLMKAIYEQINTFIKQIYTKFVQQLEESLEKYEKGVQVAILEQQQMEEHCRQLQKALVIQKNRNNILSRSLDQQHNKSLYSSAFFQQLSFSFDVDTFLRQKISEYAGQSNTFNSKIQSNNSQMLRKQFLQGQFIFEKVKKT